jgi:plastocyanin
MRVFLILALLSPAADGETIVTGTVRTDLKVRPKTLKAIEGDEKCKCLHPEPPKVDDLLVSPEGGVKAAIVRVTKGLDGRTFEPPKTEAVIDQKGCLYVPRVSVVMTGQPVAFTNGDPVAHNVHGLPFDNKEFNRGQQPGARDVLSFKKPEIFKVKCDYHPWMGAWVGVFDHPYFALTDAEGRFTIRNLPPGTYTLEVWHERLKGDPVEITVAGKEMKIPDFTLVEK